MLNLIVAPYGQNPTAEKCTKKVVKILKNEKTEYSVYFSANLDDVALNTHELLNMGETEFVLIGDDVLLHTFINNVKDVSKLKIGLIPTGKQNDFANYVGIAKKPAQAIKDILERNIETMDYLLLNNSTKVINNITIGASAEMFEIYKTYKMQNFLSKAFLFFKYGNKFEGIELGFANNKTAKPKYENVFELSIANSGYINNTPISPLSNVQDGLFNLNYAVMPAYENRKKYFKMFKKGTQIYDENTKQQWLNTVKIVNPDKRIKLLADGNLITVEELNVEVIENGLKIYRRID